MRLPPSCGLVLLLGLRQLSIQPDDGEREALVGGSWKPALEMVYIFVHILLAVRQVATYLTAREAGKCSAAVCPKEGEMDLVNSQSLCLHFVILCSTIF